MNTLSIGTKHGKSRARLLLTQITPCCRKPWRNGVSIFSTRYCRGTWRSFTKSIAAFLTTCARDFPGCAVWIAQLSLIDEGGPRYVRMANLATVGSHKINGVAQLHSELLKQT